MHATATKRIWDLPTRVFHWALAFTVIALIVAAKAGSEAALVWHARLGYGAGALLLFRLAWGFAGGHWSRFAAFPPSVRAAWRHVAGSGEHTAGHNPAGALAVYAMLLVLIAQVSSGLFVATKDDFTGPLADLVTSGVSRWLTGYHRNVGQVLVIGLVVLHVGAIAAYARRGRRLVPAMWRGDAIVTPDTPASRDDASTRLRALAVLGLCSLAMWGIVSLGN